ncbi:hypothetical protein C0993_010789 [Termitomyces sp. T159_Od127]|nr:hypothetical protein C0993_010789 [Termitomyces sp. T159_Od127]
MQNIAAYLLLQIGGNASPSAADIKKLLGAVGIEANGERVDALIAELKDKTVDELIATGSSKLASVPSGGAGGAAPAAASSAAPAAAAAEEKKEEKAEEKEESDDDMGFGLFD